MIVREQIEFQRGTDPKKSMGIGFVGKIKNAIPKISELDSKSFITDSYPPNIHFFLITLTHFEIHFFSNDFSDEDGNPIDKEQYAVQLVKEAELSDVFEDKRTVHDWTIIFYIKSQFRKYFIPGEYDVPIR